MLQKLEILDKLIDHLDEINKHKFSHENFNEVNSKIESILKEINLTLSGTNKNEYLKKHQSFFKKLTLKIENIEAKILPKANLLDSFSKSNI